MWGINLAFTDRNLWKDYTDFFHRIDLEKENESTENLNLLLDTEEIERLKKNKKYNESDKTSEDSEMEDI